MDRLNQDGPEYLCLWKASHLTLRFSPGAEALLDPVSVSASAQSGQTISASAFWSEYSFLGPAKYLRQGKRERRKAASCPPVSVLQTFYVPFPGCSRSSATHSPRTVKFSLTVQAFLLYHEMCVPKNLTLRAKNKTAYGENRVGANHSTLRQLCKQSRERTKNWYQLNIAGRSHGRS